MIPRILKLSIPGVIQFVLALTLCIPASANAQTAENLHSFDKWEKEISAYEESDRTNPPPQGALLFIGSSTIRLWTTLARDFPKHQVINRGFGGSQIVDSTHFAERIIFPYKPKMVLLRAGGNDLWAGKSAEQVFADFKNFVTKVHSKLPEAEIVFISLSPSIARWKQADAEKALNQMVESFARNTRRVKHLEAYSLPLDADGKPRPELFVKDQLHFSSEGYGLLAAKVREFLSR